MSTKTTEKTEAVPGPTTPPSRSVERAAEYLAMVVDEDHGTRNGRTALYWHLVSVISQHAGPKVSTGTRYFILTGPAANPCVRRAIRVNPDETVTAMFETGDGSDKLNDMWDTRAKVEQRARDGLCREITESEAGTLPGRGA